MLISPHTPVDSSFHELLPHGSPDFPMVVELIDFRQQVDGCVNWHWHEDLQYFMVREGEVELFVNKTRHVLHAGEGLFINSGILHMARALSAGHAASYYCLDISPTLLALYPDSVFESRYVRPFLGSMFFEGEKLTPQTSWQKTILDTLPRIIELEERRAFGTEYEILWLLAQIWLTTIAHAQAGKSTLKNQLQTLIVCQIIGYLSKHYPEQITLPAVADFVHKSPSECCRLFRSVTQMTIFKYLENYRIERAVALLKSTSLTVDLIANKVGFQTPSYFIKTFRRKLGKTPLVFRKTVQNNSL